MLPLITRHWEATNLINRLQFIFNGLNLILALFVIYSIRHNYGSKNRKQRKQTGVTIKPIEKFHKL